MLQSETKEEGSNDVATIKTSTHLPYDVKKVWVMMSSIQI